MRTSGTTQFCELPERTAWERRPDGSTAVLGPVTARIGSAVVGRPSESTRTPAGTFSLTEAFGRSGNPGTAFAASVDHTAGGIPGAGSAFFLHAGNGAATAGCVAIDAGSLGTRSRWLGSGGRPVIAIGVG